MKKTMSKAISAILCTILTFSSVTVLAAETEPVPVVNGIANPVYDSDTETSVYSYVYFGHYPQSEIKGDDLTDDIVNANYNKYGVAIVNNNQYWRVEKDSINHYFIIEPIKWKVLNIDKNYMLLQSDKIIDSYEYGYYSRDKWKVSNLRSWLNGYSSFYNKDSINFQKQFENFNSIAFSEDEFDICQLIDTQDLQLQINQPDNVLSFPDGNVGNTHYNVNDVLLNEFDSEKESIITSDYILLSDLTTVTRNAYGFGPLYNTYNKYYYFDKKQTCKKESTDYNALKSQNNKWYLLNGEVYSDGTTVYYPSGWYGECSKYSGIVPTIKILVDSDQYYTNKPELKIGKDIGSASVNLKYDSIMYDGTPKTPSVTVTENGETLEEDVDYTVKYSDNTKAGTAKVTVSGCGNYFGNIEKTFEITRKEQTISRVEDSYKLTYGDKPFRLNALTSGDGAITYQSSDENVVIAAPKTGKITIKGVGTATVTVRAAQTDNYSEAVKEIKMIVNPQKVSGVSQKSASKNSVNISWSKINGVSGYEIYRYNPDYEEYRLAKTVSGNITNSTITGLSSGKIYKFKIRAYVNGNTKTYGAFSSEFKAATKPGATIVKKFKFKIGARAWIEAKFKKISCTGYQVKFAKKKNFKGAKTYKTTSPKYSIMINSGKRWYVKVRSYVKCGNKTYYGAWSSKKSVKTY